MTRVLVVEDEESYREALSYMLAKEGFEVIEAADGAEGLAQYDRVGADMCCSTSIFPGCPAPRSTGCSVSAGRCRSSW